MSHIGSKITDEKGGNARRQRYSANIAVRMERALDELDRNILTQLGQDARMSVAVLARLGKIGTLVMIRMMAFILLCIGIQIMWTGWAELNGGAGVTVSETRFRPTPDAPLAALTEFPKP